MFFQLLTIGQATWTTMERDKKGIWRPKQHKAMTLRIGSFMFRSAWSSLFEYIPSQSGVGIEFFYSRFIKSYVPQYVKSIFRRGK